MGEVYRVPNTSEVASIERYEQITSRLTASPCHVLLATDQNFNYFNVAHHRNTLDLLNNFIASGMIPTITQATRVTPLTSTLIDNIYINIKDNTHYICSGILASDISDHFPIFLLYGKRPKNKKQPISFYTRSVEKKSVELNDSLATIDWSYLERLHVDEACEEFTRNIKSTLDTIAPLKKKTLYPNQQLLNSWMTK